MSPPPLKAQLTELARTPSLLVACDYDGTLSPIVDDPQAAVPLRESVVALRTLASLPDTHVAVVSGRSLRDLAALSRLPAEIILIGSHGSEFDAGFASALSPDTVALREMITRRLTEIASRDPGFHVEKKPASAAFHYRNADPALARQALKDIHQGPASLSGVGVKRGKMVIELTLVETDKGSALDTLRQQVAADAVLFIGDDITDEDGFAKLRGPDLGIKVGEGTSLAGSRVDDPEEVATVLALLCELRRAWLEGAGAPPIEQHAFLSDQRTVALVSPEGRINWLCHPRADSPAVFAELIGGHHAGFFSVRPDHESAPLGQRYLGQSLMLETRWAGLTVTDYLDASGGRVEEPAGHSNLIRSLEGVGTAIIEFAPRLDYGRAPTQIEVTPKGLQVRGTSQNLQLLVEGGPVHWEIEDDGPHQTASGRLTLGAEPIVLDLAFDASDRAPRSAKQRWLGTETYWHDWASRLELPDTQRDAVLRSALTLKGLCHTPTGAILAAATTSLPEVPGGVRNWDYRYCWPRDAALSAMALVALGSTAEARDLLDWIMTRVEHVSEPDQLRPLYAVAGDEYLPEAVLPTLHGYLGSRPVRIGNAADQQVQLDVFGPIVELVFTLATKGKDVTDCEWQLVEGMVGAVGKRWREPDHGIWEERRPQRHHVHSKVMCWLAVDRGLKIATLSGRGAPDSWEPLRQEIAEDVLTNGWNADVASYTIAYGDTELDASVLWIGLSGLLDVRDERFVATVAAIERDLCHGPIVYRVPPRRWSARRRGRISHLYGLAHRGLRPHGTARRREKSAGKVLRPGRVHGSPERAVRSRDRDQARQSPSGLFTSRSHSRGTRPRRGDRDTQWRTGRASVADGSRDECLKFGRSPIEHVEIH